MSNPNYTLEIISHHPKFDSKSLRKYYVDGIDTVGAWGDEPFEIRFRNNTWQKVQVKLSVDGTDVLTGDKANTDVSNEMWVVNGYSTLSLKAWPETNNGGAQLIFTSANNSVAVHTHGDLSSRGIIAAAVYTEGHVEPVRLHNEQHHHWHTYTYPIISLTTPTYPFWVSLNDSNAGSFSKGIIRGNTSSILDSSTFDNFNVSYNACVDNISSASLNASETKASASLESLAAVGAGQYVDQKITHVAGLIKPIFAETVRVRYMWWDDLVSKLRENSVPAPHASGFPGDKKQHVMSLGNTPRIGNFNKAFPMEKPQEPVYSRI